jgi:hypothetical protein
LCATGYASASSERVVAGRDTAEVARMKITVAGRRALGN